MVEEVGKITAVEISPPQQDEIGVLGLHVKTPVIKVVARDFKALIKHINPQINF